VVAPLTAFHVKHADGLALTELARRFALPAGAPGQLAVLLTLLTKDPLAPTSVRDPARAIDDHLADSLVALELERVRGAGSIADLGAGAGLPGLALAIARPETSVALVESNRRKCEFIARAAAACGLSNATVVPTRAEAWFEGRERFELVTARALAPVPVVAEYAAPLLRLGGALLVWRGRPDPAEEAAARTASTELGLDYEAPRSVEPYSGAVQRHLQLLIKTSPTPPRFPRRPGVARKRPLGAGSRPASDRRRR
jgi:16S rRNA (guanine527-N7)-methyltransferase